jgi:hypothetical protein
MLQLHHTSITLSNIISYNTSSNTYFLQHFCTANALFIYTILQFCTSKILAEHSDLKCVSCGFLPEKREKHARLLARPQPSTKPNSSTRGKKASSTTASTRQPHPGVVVVVPPLPLTRHASRPAKATHVPANPTSPGHISSSS